MSEHEYTVENLQASVPVAEYIAECVDVPKFLVYCKECRCYNHRWACPPFDFEPLTLWRQYATLQLYTRVLTPQPGTDMDALMQGLWREKDRLLQELLKLESQTPGALALSAGSCYICGDNCTRPKGEPCRFPERTRHSIESLGGDVSKTLEKYLHKPMLWIKNGEIPAYLTLTGGLLLPEEKQNAAV